MLRISFFIPFLLLINSLSIYGQTPSEDQLKKLISQTKQYQSERPYEKVHLHMDKPYYAIGDKIWFKAYVVSSDNNQPSGISKILYAELINEKDSVYQTLKLPLLVGLAWGEFALSDNLSEGNYRIRAYTNWMRNFGEDFFFDKTIVVGNVITNNIITEVNYTYLKVGTSQKLSAEINYKDINGNPIANKDVNYEVQLGSGTISKGGAKTDNKGNLDLTFINNQPSIQKSGRINTQLKLDDKRTVTKSFPVKSTSNDVIVQFFPEGGNLIAGLVSTVAFKALGAAGLGVPVSGYLSDKANNRIAEFISEYQGMGSFRFRPQAELPYTAIVKFDDGSEKSFDLPLVQSKGCVLSIDNSDPENLKIGITATASLLNEEVTLIAQGNNKIHYVSKSKLTGGRLSTSIPKNRFPEGILHLTLFSAQNDPLAERLVFINHQQQLKIDVRTLAKDFAKREKVNLSLQVTDKDNKPVLGSFSVSVIDETKVPYDDQNETTILSNLLLTSDIKGHIQQPNYYFTAIDDNKIRQLDILMLTQGWRRFAWRNILTNTPPALVYQPDQNIAVSGKVTTKGKPVSNGKVTLFYMAGKPFLTDTFTDAQGKFKFNNLYFPDSTKLVLQARSEKDRKNVLIELDQLPPHLVTNNNLANVEVNVNKSMVTYLQNSMNQFDSLRRMGNASIMLDEVKIVAEEQAVKNSANLNGAGNADAIITGDKLSHCTFDLSQCLQGMVTGLLMREGVPYLSRNLNSSIMLPTHMLIVVDGMDVDPDYLSLISPGDVESIEVLKSAINTSIYGTKGVGGVLIITMKQGEYALRNSNTYTPGIIKFTPKGYYITREFYSPNYDDPKTDINSTDLRTTIYWNPQVITDAGGKASVGFFNADGTGNYKVVIEGINEKGHIGRNIYRYKVK